MTIMQRLASFAAATLVASVALFPVAAQAAQIIG
jgi:hypothetical protein